MKLINILQVIKVCDLLPALDSKQSYHMTCMWDADGNAGVKDVQGCMAHLLMPI